MEKTLRYVEEKLKVGKPSDWRRISQRDLKELGVERFFERCGGLAEVLTSFYPELSDFEKSTA